MKKLFILSFAVASFGFANAQIKNDRGTFTKPSAGSTIMEINFSPDVTGGPAIFSLPSISKDLELVGIKARKFKSDKKAYRFIGNLAISNSGVDGDGTNFAIGIGAGIENHMKGAERLSTYWGYEGKLGFVSGTNSNPNSPEFGEKGSKFGLAANCFTGFDYYIVPNVYLGAEVSYGLAVTNTTPDGGDGVTKFELAPGVTPSFRLGWRF
jgi:hypothetical protein